MCTGRGLTACTGCIITVELSCSLRGRIGVLNERSRCEHIHEPVRYRYGAAVDAASKPLDPARHSQGHRVERKEVRIICFPSYPSFQSLAQAHLLF